MQIVNQAEMKKRFSEKKRKKWYVPDSRNKHMQNNSKYQENMHTKLPRQNNGPKFFLPEWIINQQRWNSGRKKSWLQFKTCPLCVGKL